MVRALDCRSRSRGFEPRYRRGGICANIYESNVKVDMMSLSYPLRCMFCHKKIYIKTINNHDGRGMVVDDEDASLQQDLHFVESLGCEVLHNIMNEGK